MRRAFWPDSESREVDELLAGRPSDAHVLVAENGVGGLSGFAELGERRWAEGCDSSPVAYLEGIWVDPGARRGGIALELVRHVEDWARSNGYAELASDCALENLPSQQLHAAAGFTEVERIICFARKL